MSADDFLFIRRYEDGFLVTRETLSQDAPSDALEALARIGTDGERETDGFFETVDEAFAFVDLVYEAWEDYGRPFEYGPEYSPEPNTFMREGE
jgi:hypothetical protein